MTPHDMKTLKECLMILYRVRDQLIKQARHCKNEKARSCINKIAAEINNQVHILRKQHESPKEETNHDQQS